MWMRFFLLDGWQEFQNYRGVAEKFGKRPHKGVSPDEAVVLGVSAAVQAGSLRSIRPTMPHAHASAYWETVIDQIQEVRGTVEELE
ncbi:hypothetical protein IFM89_013609 [Coptis chinensis]|uniref:Uncharacterized protein n=1 Tax=Coptis chinensis TaxID=261450 RepID=A0A835IPR0_9MAGN|nr:hypothetical protein IFM89_013609 [Coptis chinensis]